MGVMDGELYTQVQMLSSFTKPIHHPLLIFCNNLNIIYDIYLYHDRG